MLFYILLCIKSSKAVSLDQTTIDLLTPAREFGETCGYESCPVPQQGSINVHIVPHTHGELGYTRTFYEHYTGFDSIYAPSKINMKRILDYTISELWANENRKFTLADTAYFFQWWSQRDATVRRMVYQLLRQGRLYLVGGGWSMPDEATTSYHAIIDQYTYALRKINATFLECGRPLVTWQSDVFGHSREFTSLVAQMGFDGHFINPISFDDELARMERNALEFVWRGSDELGPETDIYTHKLFDGYWSPPGFCFGGQCGDPLFVTSDTTFKNVEERVTTFIKQVTHRQSPYYTTNNIMVVLGQRLGYYDASIWFENIDKLIDNVNIKGASTGNSIKLFYSTPACYLRAVYDANLSLTTKQDDFLPYSYDRSSYAVGMYTSRPALKYLLREAHRYLQIIKQLQVTARLRYNAKLFERFMWINGVVQDHNIITGALREHVKKYYIEKLHSAIQSSTLLIKDAFNKLRRSPENTTYYRCVFNESSCLNSNSLEYFIVIYNPLSWNVTVPVRLPMFGYQYVVYHPSGLRLKASLIKIAEPITNIPSRRSKAGFELVFMAENIPPLGFRSYYLRHRQAGWKREKRVIIKKRNSKSNKNKHLVKQDNFYVGEKANEATTDDYSDNIQTTAKNKVVLDHVITTRNIDTTNIDNKNIKSDVIIPNIQNEFIDRENNDKIDEETDNISKNNGTKTRRRTFVPSDDELRVKPISNGNSTDDEDPTRKNETIDEVFNRNKIIEEEDLESQFDRAWKSYQFIESKDDFIRNRYIRLTVNKQGKIIHVGLSNGINITLDIQFLFYTSDEPSKFGRNDKNPGAYIFRPMDARPEIILDNFDTKIYKSRMVQEIHTRFSNYASFVVKLYRRRPVIEVDWLVGPIPVMDEIGKEVFIRYSTDLVNNEVFYTDSNGRQTLKRIRNRRASYDPVVPDPIPGNYYPVTSKIFIEDTNKNIRFAVFNDRAQGGTSLNDGDIDIMLNRRILTDDAGIQAVLNETEGEHGVITRGTHYLYFTKADYKPNKIFEKKFAKEIELKPIIMLSSETPYGKLTKKTWFGQINEFSALKGNLPLGIHILTLESWDDDTILIRLENYLEKNDAVKSGVKKVFLKKVFKNLNILSVKETTLAGNIWLENWMPLKWRKKERFLKNFNEAFGTGNLDLDSDRPLKVYQPVDLDSGIVLVPQQIRTFVVTFEYVGDV